MEALPVLPDTPGNNSPRRSVPDVPENVNFYMDHLNDPNFDFDASSRSKYDSFELERKPSPFYATPEAGTEPQYGSDRHLVSSKTEPLRTSLAFEFDEYVLSFLLSTLPTTKPYNVSESPYPEVRAAVATVDDPFMPVNTFRM
jgi:hypothetical protein